MGKGRKCKRGITVPHDGCPLSQPPQSLRDSSPMLRTGEPVASHRSEKTAPSEDGAVGYGVKSEPNWIDSVNHISKGSMPRTGWPFSDR